MAIDLAPPPVRSTIRSRPSVEEWTRPIVTSIESMGQLAKGWDGHAGVPATRQAIEMSIVWIEELARHADDLRLLPRPHSTATPEGGVLFHWSLSTVGSLEIEFSPQSMTIPATYSYFESGTRDSLEGTIRQPHDFDRWPFPLKLFMTHEPLLESDE